MPVLAVAFPVSAVLLAFLAVLLRSQRGEVAPAPWLNAAIIGSAVYLGLSMIYASILRTQVRGPLGTRLREEGVDPVYFVGLAGMSIFFCPVAFAWFLCFFGLDLGKLLIATGVSLLGLLLWAWVYRPRNDSGDAA